VIPAENGANTYSLLPEVRGGLVWTSTLGADLLARGRWALVAANAPYLQLGVGRTGASKEDYFHQLLLLARGTDDPPEEMRRNALLYQWIMFREISLEATSTQHGAWSYRLEPDGARPEEEHFYRFLTGEVDRRFRTDGVAVGS
jgi:hypothetical protein